MRRTLIGFVLVVPALLSAQVSAQGKAQSQTAATASSPNAQASAQARLRANANASFNAPERFSADGKAKLEAMFAEAWEHKLSAEPMARRVAEGEAKGASEVEILAAAGRVKADMETTQHVLLAAGRPKASPDECARGAMLMARGVTSAQIETMARHTPSDRSLVVAFDVVSRLAAQGLPVTQALARVQSKIDARASDATLLRLAGAGSANAAGGVGNGARAGATGAVGATAGAATNAAGVGAGVTGTVAGAVGGVVKKP